MATHAPSFGSLDLPRPGRAALPLLALALVALALEASPELRLAGLAAAACFVLAAAVRAERARAELRAIRRSADRLILASARGVVLLRRLLRGPGSPLYDEHAGNLSRAFARVLMELEP